MDYVSRIADRIPRLLAWSDSNNPAKWEMLWPGGTLDRQPDASSTHLTWRNLSGRNVTYSMYGGFYPWRWIWKGTNVPTGFIVRLWYWFSVNRGTQLSLPQSLGLVPNIPEINGPGVLGSGAWPADPLNPSNPTYTTPIEVDMEMLSVPSERQVGARQQAYGWNVSVQFIQAAPLPGGQMMGMGAGTEGGVF